MLAKRSISKMRGIVKYFIHNELAGNILMILLFLLGIFGYSQMKTTFFPEVESRFINIQAIHPGAAPQEIEEGIVAKIEDKLEGLTGIERVTSVCSENAGTITVEILKSYDTDIILQDVKNAVDGINSFPISMEPLTISKQENLGRVISFAVYGDVDLLSLKRIARKIEDDLLGMDGISKISLSGFPEEELEVSFSEEALRLSLIHISEPTRPY